MNPKFPLNPRSALLLGALVTAPALAQTPVKTFDLEQVTLSPGGQHSLVLTTGDVLEKGQLRLFLAGQYQHKPLVFVRNDEIQGSVVGRRWSAHLGVAYGLTDSVELALQLPVILSQGGDDLSGLGIAPVSGTVLGAPVLQGRFVLARQSDSALGDIGLNLGLLLPLGSSTGLTQDPGAGFAFNAGIGFGHNFGSLLRVGAEVGAVIRQSERLSNYADRIIDQVGSYATGGVTVSTLGDGLRGEVTARALLALTQTMSAGEVLVGARYPLPLNLEVFALAGPGIGKMPGNPAFRAFAGLAFRPFPSKPREEPKPQEPMVCPACPVCPAPTPAPEPTPCPAPPPPPPAPPAPADYDKDGIPDEDDACPLKPGVAAHEGCPPPEPPKPPYAEYEEARISIKDQVRFATGKSDILPESFPLLDEVAKILKEHPELVRLRIGGHTDNRGTREFNIKLSQDRAEAVRRYLVERGVAPTRLEAKGFGPDQPIASNDTAEGRQRNRRTEFISNSKKK
ncbi:OmpA family protein [Cystobacter fuscus]|uniref:OmpA family protein n=1 Tax=Cystobacter fuscus TaxID=43 RepID=UPI002B2FEAD7|nr:OmpA family protein [Cystobacter fuscus]